MARSAVLALDVGGTKCEAGVVLDDGTVVTRRRAPSTGHPDGEAFLTTITSIVDAVLDEARVALPGLSLVACGVGSGGPMSAGGELLSPLNIAVWRDFPLRARLAERYSVTTFVDNDAKALALGEGWLGAARGERNYLAMVVSTGVGGGIVLDGRLLDGASGNAGHIGHMIVEPGGRPCACGAVGCLEAEASGTSIAAITGRPAAEADLATRRRTGRLVGRAVASVVSLLDVRLALVAGSVALGYGEDFLGAAREELARSARLGYAHGATIRFGGLGADGPLLGAAAVGWRGAGAPRPGLGADDRSVVPYDV